MPMPDPITKGYFVVAPDEIPSHLWSIAHHIGREAQYLSAVLTPITAEIPTLTTEKLLERTDHVIERLNAIKSLMEDVRNAQYKIGSPAFMDILIDNEVINEH